MASQQNNEQVNDKQASQIKLIHGRVGTQGRLTLELINELNRLCDQLEDTSREQLGVLLLQLDSRVSCVEPECHKDVYLISKWEKLLRRLELTDGAVICAASDNIGHLGLALLLVSDYRLANELSQFSLCNEQGHLLAGCALQRLAHQFGSGACRKLVLFGNTLNAVEAKNIGLIDELGADSGVLAQQYIDSLQPNQLNDIRVRRQLLLEAFHLGHDEALGAHLAACDRSLRGHEAADSEKVDSEKAQSLETTNE